MKTESEAKIIRAFLGSQDIPQSACVCEEAIVMPSDDMDILS